MNSVVGRELITQKGKHRLHDRLNTLLVITSSISIASTYVVEGKVDLVTIACIVAECIQYPGQVLLPFVGPLETALKNKKPDQIQIQFVPKTASQSHRVTTDGLMNITSN